MNKVIIIFILMLTICFHANSQHVISVQDATNKEILSEVLVRDTSNKITHRTNAKGFVTVNNKSNKSIYMASYLGYERQYFTISTSNDTTFIFLIPFVKEQNEVVISATRTNARIENIPIKIEVLGLDEMHDENTIKPGNVASLIGDFSGIQIQQLSATNGSSSVRFFGLDGKYSMILHDGLPIYQGLSSSFGILQIPPLDLQQIELIKGPSSTLYGGGAVSGLLNFVSKTPSKTVDKTITISQSTLGETNLNAYYSNTFKKVGVSLFTASNHQFIKDIDKDGYSDIPYMQNFIIHPKLFFPLNEKTKATIGYTLINETRKGGDMLAYKSSSDTAHQYLETTNNFRQIIDANITKKINQYQTLQLKGGINLLKLKQQNNVFQIGGINWNEASELNYSFKKNRSHFITGINFYSNGFNPTKNTDTTKISSSQNTLGMYAQYNYARRNKINYQIGIRADKNFHYGLFVLPSTAVLFNWNQSFTTRINVGMGYKTPDVFDYNGIGLDGNKISINPNTKAEKSTGGNIDLSYNHSFKNEIGIKFNTSFFLNTIQLPIYLKQKSANQLEFINANANILTKGVDNYLRITYKEFELYLGYTFVNAKKKYDTLHPFIELTPTHKFATTITYEIEHQWRFGIESAFTGKQYLYDGSKTKSYLFFAAMIKREFNKMSIVLNGENLLNFKQSTYEKIVTPSQPLPTFKPLWASIDGRNINLTLLLKF